MTIDQKVLAALGAEPVPAPLIAHRIGERIEAVYGALVRLYDAGAATMDMAYKTPGKRVQGWVRSDCG